MRVKLTPREFQVLELVLRGLTNAEIAKKLKVKEGTIKLHVTSIYRTYGLKSRNELMAKYIDKRIFKNFNKGAANEDREVDQREETGTGDESSGAREEA